MIKNRLDYKLINLALIAVIAYLLYKTGDLWISIFNKAGTIIFPLLVGFVVAYALYPGLKYLIDKKIPKGLGIFMLMAFIIGLIILIIVLLVPMLSKQLVSLFDMIIVFIKDISVDYNVNFGELQSTITETLNQIITNLGKYVSDGAVKTINTSISVISNLFIVIASSIYLLIDMDKIRLKIKIYLKKKSKRVYSYVVLLDQELRNYLKGFFRIVFISFFEYVLVYTIVGHPNALLLGFLSSIGNFVPYFGGLAVNVIAAITAFSISKALFIKVIIALVLLSALDAYVINPFVYGKTNKVHPLIVITSVFAGGILFGIIGIVIALPVSILIITTFKYYEDSISEKIEDLGVKKRGRKNAKTKGNI